jgi:DNA-binding MarR family transcriptional regulator
MTLSSTIVAIDRLAAAHRSAAIPVLRELGLSETEGSLLWALGGSSLTMGAAASALSCDPSNLTVLARHLESLGFAERVDDPSDRRRRRLQLTASGRDAVGMLARAVEASTGLAALSADERATLDALLAKARG